MQVQHRVPYFLARMDGGLNISNFSPRQRLSPAADGVASASSPCIRTVGYAGRLVFDKNPHLFVRAASLVSQRQKQRQQNSTEVPNAIALCVARFVMTGDGELRRELEAEARRLNVDVEWRGAASPQQMPAVLKSYDIFAFPTFCDSFGRVQADFPATLSYRTC